MGDRTAARAVDGDTATIWHTEWSSQPGDDNDPAHPHEFIIDLGASATLSGLRYLPRQDGSPNGGVADYAVFCERYQRRVGYRSRPPVPSAGARQRKASRSAPRPGPGNTPPVLTNPGNQSTLEGSDAVTLLLSASDADGDALTFDATGLPPGLGINAATGLVQGTLTAPGTFNVNISVSDGQDSDNAGFTWTVAAQNVAPVLNAVR